jgi:ribosome-associated toxin RatA of RatAB toxin-antitoxin module
MSRHIIHALTTGRRAIVCRWIVVMVAIVIGAGVETSATSEPDSESGVIVSEDKGVYSVRATFEVAQPASIAFAVLTDYPAIPQFMPEIRSSVVRERVQGRAVVVQEATARFLLFSKKIHLVLEIAETPALITFRDRCNTSFAQYEGSWRISEDGQRTRLQYELTARPSFSVPEFLLQRLLKRDAARMVKGLQAEIVRRGAE